MRNRKERRLAFYFMRILGIAIVGLLVNIGIIANMDTYAWYGDSSTSSITMKAVSQENIVQISDIAEDDSDGAVAIVMQKSPQCTYDPIIYFSVEGPVADYILHINPVALSSGGCYNIPIDTDLNLMQYIKLLKCNTEWITGNIRIMYLNGFISEEKPVRISRRHLIDRFKEKLKRSTQKADGLESYNGSVNTIPGFDMNMSLNKQEDSVIDIFNNELNDPLTSLINYVASFCKWDKVNWTAENELFSKASMTVQQEAVVDSVVPGLREYINLLYDNKEKFRNDYEESLKAIDALNIELNDLKEIHNSDTEKLSALMKENSMLQSEIASMKQELSEQSDINNAAPVSTEQPKVNGTENTVKDTETEKKTGSADPSTTEPAKENGIENAVQDTETEKKTDSADPAATEPAKENRIENAVQDTKTEKKTDSADPVASGQTESKNDTAKP